MATTVAADDARPSRRRPAAGTRPHRARRRRRHPAHGGVLAIAASLLGIPYVYGGSTPAGFDCSGFTMYVFARAGISLPRTAAGQQAASTPVSNPQPR
ncbi:MAG: C40 family peptidase [Tetrasphaera sp.]|nr:C40 family peptidase [Tetrasphaera sp.]